MSPLFCVSFESKCHILGTEVVKKHLADWWEMQLAVITISIIKKNCRRAGWESSQSGTCLLSWVKVCCPWRVIFTSKELSWLKSFLLSGHTASYTFSETVKPLVTLSVTINYQSGCSSLWRRSTARRTWPTAWPWTSPWTPPSCTSRRSASSAPSPSPIYSSSPTGKLSHQDLRG